MKECPTCRCCFPDRFIHCRNDGAQLMPTLAGDGVLDGRYELKRRLGQGGMGSVYEARHSFLKTVHAVKVISPEFLEGHDPEFVRRFRQEAMAAANIRHRNVIRVTDFGIANGTMPFLVMDFIRGVLLHHVLLDEKVLPAARALEIIEPVAHGVEAAHRLGIVHRDLKPLNIILEDGLPPRDGVKVLDFGLAKIKAGELLGSFVAAKSSGVMGSPFYMAPEQWSDAEFDARTDIYSLGIILYQMLAGDVPFKGPSAPSIMKKHLMDEPPRFNALGATVHPRIESVVRHALQKDPERRPESAQAFIQELRAAIEAAEAARRIPVSEAATWSDALIPETLEISTPSGRHDSDPDTHPHDSGRGSRDPERNARLLAEIERAQAEARRRTEEEWLRREEEERLKRAEEERLRREEAERLQREEEERLKREEEARLRREEEERLRREEEERLRREAEARRRREEEERLKREQEERRRREEEEARRRAAEEARRRLDEEMARMAAEAEEAQRRAAAEERRRETAALRRAEQKERLRREAERLRRVEEERLRREEEARLRREAEEKLKREEEAKLRREEAERLRREEAERLRREEEARLKREEDERVRREEEERLKREEAERLKRAEEEERLRLAEEARLKRAESKRKRAEEERLRLEEAERLRREEEERLKRQAEEELKKKEEERLRREEEERLRRAEEARLKREEEERLKREEAERLRLAAEAHLKREEEERLRREAEERQRAAAEAEQRRREEEARVAEAERQRRERELRQQREHEQRQEEQRRRQQEEQRREEERRRQEQIREEQVREGQVREEQEQLARAAGAVGAQWPAQTPEAPPGEEETLAGAGVDAGRSERNRLIAIVLAALFVLVVGVVGLFIYFRPAPRQPPPPRPAENRPVAAATNADAPAQGTPAASGSQPLKPDMVNIAGGRFMMGRNDVSQTPELMVQYPAHPVTVGPFQMDRTEVTNAEYAAFVRETGHAPPQHWKGKAPPAEIEKLPVVHVSLLDAQAFARWRSKRDGVSYRLPTEQEWEFAARGPNNNLYPWGNAWTEDRAKLTGKAPSPVGSYPQGAAQGSGALDLIGNVWEWTSSEARLYPGNDKFKPKEQGLVVARGGSYQSLLDEEAARQRGGRAIPATIRLWLEKETRAETLGFRLVRSLP